MRVLMIVLSATLFSSGSALAQGPGRSAPWLPIQLEMRVPFAPTAVPSEQRIHLLYELQLTNFETAPLHLTRIEVLDANGASTAPPIATFTAQQLPAMVKPIGPAASSRSSGVSPSANTKWTCPMDPQIVRDVPGSCPICGMPLEPRTLSSDSQGDYQIAGGGSAIVLVSIALDQGSHVPARLLHRVVAAEGVMEGAVITTHHTTLRVLGPPLEGANWLAHEGPGGDNHHRREMIILNGKAVISTRYAIDWNKVEKGDASFGDEKNLHSYYGYGQPVVAVADGKIVSARDGLPDNVPAQGDAFQPSVPITMETWGGNTIVLDLGGGQFARYMHLQPGSLRVKSGDRVRRGQVLARVGSSGDSRGPHLHFEVTTSSKPGGQGVPYVIDSYGGTSADGHPMGQRKYELPLKNTLVVFAEHQGGGAGRSEHPRTRKRE